jgi:hypothetical protein
MIPAYIIGVSALAWLNSTEDFCQNRDPLLWQAVSVLVGSVSYKDKRAWQCLVAINLKHMYLLPSMMGILGEFFMEDLVSDYLPWLFGQRVQD